MQIDILTLFPEMFQGPFSTGLFQRAVSRGLIRIGLHNFRDYTHDRHRTVDDYPYGGGAGMILKPEPIFKAVEKIKKENPDTSPRIIFMTPQGEQYSQTKAKILAQEKHLIFICGHYRGVDERVIEALVTDEISIGDYILTGGELAAAVVIDSAVRLIPGVLGDFDSAEGDSFSSGRLDYPHYTRPEVFQGMRVPNVLLSGHHARIEAWRKNQAMERTLKRRPDLLENNGSGKTVD